MTALIAGTEFFVIVALVGAVALLWDAARTRRGERDEARAERDTAVREVRRLWTKQADADTIPLPRWQNFLKPEAAALPADATAHLLDQLERHANGEDR